jgi:hypothetical protein
MGDDQVVTASLAFQDGDTNITSNPVNFLVVGNGDRFQDVTEQFRSRLGAEGFDRDSLLITWGDQTPRAILRFKDLNSSQIFIFLKCRRKC